MPLAQANTPQVAHSWVEGGGDEGSQMWQMQPALSPSPGAQARSVAHSDDATLAARTESLQVRQTGFNSQLFQLEAV